MFFSRVNTKNKNWKAFPIVALLSIPALGKENVVVCKNIGNVFTDAEGEHQGAPARKTQSRSLGSEN